MKKTDGRLAGILGTVIIHLVAGIFIMAFQIRELHIKSNMILDLELVAEFENRDNGEELRLPEFSGTSSGTTIERALQGDEELLNIARNLASSTTPVVVSRDDYIDMVKDELIRGGQLGVNNYIDQGRQQSSNNDYFVPVNTSPVRNNEEVKTSAQEVSANYKGPTRIEYSLENRTHTYLPIPIYKCQGAGKITLRIEVTPNGSVEKAIVLVSESVTDECLIETAINSAYITKFNSNINAPRVQTGTLTFHFVAQ